MKLPCHIKCCKCGSGQINRHHYFKGEKTYHFKSSDESRIENDFFKEDTLFIKIKKECIFHMCLTCNYKWASDVLIKEKV